jgi:hypothetical protein
VKKNPISLKNAIPGPAIPAFHYLSELNYLNALSKIKQVKETKSVYFLASVWVIDRAA